MLYYSNIISDPYPDVIDPVTGDWLPKSYNDVKADSISRARRKAEDAMMKSDMKAVASMLSSILK